MPDSSLRLSGSLRRMALGCFFVSGACGLAYEIVWIRQISLVAGATAPAVSIVLAVFMGGLALGARVFGPAADRSANPLRLYAWLELGIAVYGLLQPSLLAVARTGYVAFAQQAALEGLGLFVARVAVAAAVLLVPCVLMGGTLPVLARFVGRSQERFGLDLGTLYAVNLAGAVAGSLLTGFVLVRALGLSGTILTAVIGNALVGLAAILAAGSSGAPPAEEPVPEDPPAPTPPRLRSVLWLLAGLSGFATMGYQLTWTRMLSFGFDSTVYAFTVTLVTFLLGLALGSLTFAHLDRRARRLPVLLGAHVLGGLSAVLLAPLAARQPDLMAALATRFGLTAWAQLAGMSLGASAVMLLPATLMGIVFPLIGRLLVDELGALGRQLGRAYWINTAGAILGSLLTGFLLVPAWSLKGCLLFLAVAQVLAGLLLLPHCGWVRRTQLGLGTAALAALLVAVAGFETLLPGLAPFDRAALGADGTHRLRAHRDDATASVSVVETPSGGRALRINGFEAASDDASAAYMPMMSHLPLLLHPRPQRELVICFGTGSTAGATLLHPGVRVDVVEINASVLRMAPYFERTNHGVFKDPRARLIVDDGRNHLLTTRETYDVITSEPMPPTHAGVVNLYSREYYELARERLAPGGLLVQWLPFHLVDGGEALDILRSVQAVFHETTLWYHSHTGVIVARADGPVRMDWGRLQQAWREPGLRAELLRLGLPEPEAFAALFLSDAGDVAEETRSAHVVSDDHPSLEFHAPRFRQRRRIGPYTFESAPVLASLFARRAGRPLPLDGVPADELARVQTASELELSMRRAGMELLFGHAPSARQLYQQALTLGPGPARRSQILLGLALGERLAGSRDEARRLLREALDLDSSNQRARELLAELSAAP